MKQAFLLIVVAIGLAGWPQSSRGAVQSIDVATFTSPPGDLTLLSITAGGIVYGELTVALTGTPSVADAARLWNSNGGSDPGIAALAISDPPATTGILNSNATFQFGRTLDLNERLFFVDLDSNVGGDQVTIRPVDSTGSVIGDYQFSLAGSGSAVGGSANSDNYGPAILVYTVSRSNGADLVNFGLKGFTFTLADLNGTSGDLSQSTGFSVLDTFGTLTIDPMVAGIAAIPEPGSALLLLGTCALTGWRRRRQPCFIK